MTSQSAPESTDNSTGFGGVVLASTLLAAALVLALFTVGARFVPALAPTVGVQVVTFDVLKYTNAQRAVASAFVRKDSDQTQASELLLNLSERTRSAIEEVAGPGTLVVLKQAVVQGQTEDITAEVLERLGLPADVPTSDAAAYQLDVAPTFLSDRRIVAPSAPPEPPKATTTRPQQLP